jgi:hypothetical protein
MSNNNIVSPVSKDQYVKNLIRSIAAIENEMEPYKEQKRELRKEFIENGWLTKEEMRAAIKAYRIVKSEEDFDEIERMYYRISGQQEE